MDACTYKGHAENLARLLLLRELELVRWLPHEELVRSIGAPISKRIEEDEAGPPEVEIRVEWADSGDGAVRIRASFAGPCWMQLVERIEETVVVPPPTVKG